MAKLSQLAGKLNPKLQPSSNQTGASTDNVDLDQLFNFLGDVQTDSVRSDSVRSSHSETTSGEQTREEEPSILDEIDRQMSDLQNEIDRCYKGTTAVDNEREDSVTPPPPPPPLPVGADVCREMSPPPLPPCTPPPLIWLTDPEGGLGPEPPVPPDRPDPPDF